MNINKRQIEKQLNSFFNTVLNTEVPKKVKAKMTKITTLIYNTAITPRGGKTEGGWGVPVDTGNLRSSIKKEVKVEASHAIGRIWQDAAIAPYGVHVEYGHHAQNGKWVPPQSFMRTALDRSKSEIHKILTEQ